MYSPRFYFLAVVLCAGLVLSPSVIQDPDLWWHLRTAEWITANGTIPRADPFSSANGDTPWFAYTWAFDLILGTVYRAGGGTGICWLVAAICSLIGVWILYLGKRSGHSAVFTFAMMAAALVALSGYATPRPWWCSAAGLIGVLELVRRWEVRGGFAMAVLLPTLFMLWANMHIQFVYGLGILLLWIVTLAVRREPLGIAALSVAGAAAATFLNPYGAGLYFQALDYAGHASLAEYIEELRNPSLSEPYMAVVAALGVAAWVALLWRRPQPFAWCAGLLLAGTVLYVRSRRDGWFLVLTAVWLLFQSLPPVRWEAGRLTRAAVVTAAVVLFVRGVWQVRPDSARAAIAAVYPVAAVRHLPVSGSVFTPFDWGGFVLWSHPETKVTLDGRTNVHGVERTIRLIQVWSGERSWRSEPEFQTAAATIAPAQSSLAAQLRRGAEFHVVYEDAVAVVFVPAAAR